MDDKAILISIDGGGSKTEFCVHSHPEGKNNLYVFGSTNYKNVGFEIAEKNLTAAFFDILKRENISTVDVEGIVIGLSGLDSPSDLVVYKKMVESLKIPTEKIRLYNDCELAFRSVSHSVGICTVAGTGSIAMAFDENESIHRVGGWGGLLSDEGSGYWIAQKVLHQLLKYCDTSENYIPIFDKLKEFYEATDFIELPSILSELSITEIAASTRMIMEYAATGDSKISSVIEDAACIVANLTIVLSRRIGLADHKNASFVITGSLFKDLLFLSKYREEVNSKLGNQIDFVHVSKSTAENGIQLARKIFFDSNLMQ